MHFCDFLIEQARKQPCSIALPEATDPRILSAALRAHQTGIANCQLIGEATAIKKAAVNAGIILPDDINILQPAEKEYVPILIKLRAQRNKHIDEDNALAMLASPVAQALMLVHEGSIAGMVAGAITRSSDVLRPALQILGLEKNTSLASSAFLMCFDNGMKVFSDCALNISPDHKNLAAIALHSAATARAFGLQPVIAMLSYSSGASGSGSHVERVVKATALVKQQLPDTMVTGPIQYDAAVSEKIAALKIPDEKAAGKANVLIFPDIQAGNITYKAVQQSTGIVSIGPIMQGLAAPVNDLSRGASTDDIYYTIAATVVQAQKKRLIV